MIQSSGDFLQKCLPVDYKIKFTGALFKFFIQPCVISKKEYGVWNAPRTYETFMLHVLAT